jgi:hypothetical protein
MECGFGQVEQAIGPFISAIQLLNPIHTRCANPLGCMARPQSSGQGGIAS